MHAYYRFARNADDVADAADLSPEEKLRRLDRMAAVLDGANGREAPAAAAMRPSLLETGIDPAHCHDLLDAFRQDATKTRYADWGELMAYCRLSAAPVGRYLLDLHGESTAHLAGLRCALRRLAGDQSPAGLCQGLPAHSTASICRCDWMAADGTGVEDLANPRRHARAAPYPGPRRRGYPAAGRYGTPAAGRGRQISA